MDLGTEKSIKEMLERAEQEKGEILQIIENLLQSRLPQILEDSKKILETFQDLAKGFNLNFNSNSDIKALVETIAIKLNSVKTDLETMVVNEENVLNGSSISNARKVLDLVEEALEQMKTRVLNSNKENLVKAYKQKQELQAEQRELIERKTELQNEKIELEKEKAYLQGQEDCTKSRKNRTKTKEEIDQINERINEVNKRINIINVEIDLTSSKMSELKYKGEEYLEQGETQEGNQEGKKDGARSSTIHGESEGNNR